MLQSFEPFQWPLGKEGGYELVTNVDLPIGVYYSMHKKGMKLKLMKKSTVYNEYLAFMEELSCDTRRFLKTDWGFILSQLLKVND